MLGLWIYAPDKSAVIEIHFSITGFFLAVQLMIRVVLRLSRFCVSPKLLLVSVGLTFRTFIQVKTDLRGRYTGTDVHQFDVLLKIRCS